MARKNALSCQVRHIFIHSVNSVMPHPALISVVATLVWWCLMYGRCIIETLWIPCLRVSLVRDAYVLFVADVSAFLIPFVTFQINANYQGQILFFFFIISQRFDELTIPRHIRGLAYSTSNGSSAIVIWFIVSVLTSASEDLPFSGRTMVRRPRAGLVGKAYKITVQWFE